MMQKPRKPVHDVGRNLCRLRISVALWRKVDWRCLGGTRRDIEPSAGCFLTKNRLQMRTVGCMQSCDLFSLVALRVGIKFLVDVVDFGVLDVCVTSGILLAWVISGQECFFTLFFHAESCMRISGCLDCCVEDNSV